MPFTSSGCILYHLLSIVVPCSQTTNIVLQEMHGSYSLNNVFVETKCKSDSIACLHVKLFHTYTISALSWYLVLPISLPPNRVCKPKWHRHYPSVGLLDTYTCSDLTLQAVVIFSWVDYEPFTYGRYTYPAWASVLGWLMTCVVLVALVLPGFIIALRNRFRGRVSQQYLIWVRSYLHFQIYL